jgi:hypothetical protein
MVRQARQREGYKVLRNFENPQPSDTASEYRCLSSPQHHCCENLKCRDSLRGCRTVPTAHCNHCLHSWRTRPLTVPVKTSVAVGVVQNTYWCTYESRTSLLFMLKCLINSCTNSRLHTATRCQLVYSAFKFGISLCVPDGCITAVNKTV